MHQIYARAAVGAMIAIGLASCNMDEPPASISGNTANSCDTAGENYGPIGADQTVHDTVIKTNHVGKGSTLTVKGDYACIKARSVASNVTLRAEGKGVVIFVGEATSAVNLQAHAVGENATVTIFAAGLLQPGDASVSGKGARLEIHESKGG